MDNLLVAAVLFLAGLIQSLSGFGSALVAMPLLMPLLGTREAAPLMVGSSLALQIVLLARHWRALSLQAVWLLSLAAVVMIPLGAMLVRVMDERWIFAALAVVLLGYSGYAMSGLRLPRLRHRAWAILCGGVAGLLGGACNTDGPPVIIYGNCRRWNPSEFKGNLQAFFMVNTVIIMSSHLVMGHFTGAVWQRLLVALPALMAGAGLGVLLDRFVREKLFRRICLGLLMLLGLRLAWLAWATA